MALSLCVCSPVWLRHKIEKTSPIIWRLVGSCAINMATLVFFSLVMWRIGPIFPKNILFFSPGCENSPKIITIIILVTVRPSDLDRVGRSFSRTRCFTGPPRLPPTTLLVRNVATLPLFFLRHNLLPVDRSSRLTFECRIQYAVSAVSNCLLASKNFLKKIFSALL